MHAIIVTGGKQYKVTEGDTLFIEKLPGLDAVSLGPELRDIHSPRERLGVASTERVYRLVCEFLKRSK